MNIIIIQWKYEMLCKRSDTMGKFISNLIQNATTSQFAGHNNRSRVKSPILARPRPGSPVHKPHSVSLYSVLFWSNRHKTKLKNHPKMLKKKLTSGDSSRLRFVRKSFTTTFFPLRPTTTSSHLARPAAMKPADEEKSREKKTSKKCVE